MKTRSLFIVCCVLLAAGSVLGQSAARSLSNTSKEFMSPGPVTEYQMITRVAIQAGQQPGNTDPARELRQGFREVSGWVTKAADMVPAEKYNYRPVETVRTFGQLIAHIADSYNFFCARATGNKVEWSDAIEKGATDKATLVPKLQQALEKCTAAYDAPDGHLGELLGNVGHTSLHYGNLITYIRMLGMKPPSS